MSIKCHSERILNPFRGVMNTISTDAADAVTIDGIRWEIYIHNRFHEADDDPEEFADIRAPDICFGEWTKKGGLKKAPSLDSCHYDVIQNIGNGMVITIQQFADQIPFQLDDNYEFWLLDSEHHQPLALLDSACREDEIITPDSLIWKAGFRCRAQFNSTISHLIEEDIETHGDLLDHLINKRAGEKPAAQWFHRTENGYGTGLTGTNITKRHLGRELSPRLFPRMFIEQTWEDEYHEALFNDFINWLSPLILLMDFLKDDQRQYFEFNARTQALLVEKMHLLYPKIISERDINAARVEAALRKSLSEPQVDKLNPDADNH